MVVPFVPLLITKPPQKMGLYVVVRTVLPALVIAPVTAAAPFTVRDVPVMAPAIVMDAFLFAAVSNTAMPFMLLVVSAPQVMTPVAPIVPDTLRDAPVIAPVTVAVPDTLRDAPAIAPVTLTDAPLIEDLAVK